MWTKLKLAVFSFFLSLPWLAFCQLEPAHASEHINPLARFSPHVSDAREDPIQREARLAEIVAEADSVVKFHADRWRGDSRMLLALVLAKGWHETRYASGAPLECVGPGDCDRGKAWHYWQTHTPPERRLDGQLGLFVAVQDATVALIRGANYCGGEGRARLEGAVSLYATGKTCSWSGAKERVDTAYKIRRMLK